MDVKVISKYRLGEAMELGFPFSIIRWTHAPGDLPEVLFRRNFWKLVYVIAGKGSIEINGHEYLLSPGTVLFIHPESETRYRLAETKLEICNLCFLPELIEDRLEKLRDPSGFFSILRPGSSAPPEAVRNLCVQSAPPSVAGLFRKMEREYRSGRNNCREMLRTQLIELLLLLERNACRLRNRRRSGGPEPARTVLAYLAEHLESGVDYEELTLLTGLSRSRLGVLFRRETGENISSAYLRLRLKRAKELLAGEEEFSIPELCRRCGFRDISYFYRRFRREFGTSPRRTAGR